MQESRLPFIIVPYAHTLESINKLVIIFLIFEDILVIYASHHHMKYTSARFLPRLSWHVVRLSCQFILMSLTCPRGIFLLIWLNKNFRHLW